MAMASREKGFDPADSSSNSDVDSLRLNEALPMPPLPPLPSSFPPPPTAPIRDKRKRVQIREAPRAIETLPRIIPPPPPIPGDDPSSSSPSPRSPLSPLLARVQSKRRTIMERIEGWWDLDLLEKRQTLLGRNVSTRSRRV